MNLNKLSKKQLIEQIRELHDKNQSMEFLTEASPLAIITVDPEGNILFWNSAAEKMSGWSKAEVMGSSNPIFNAAKRIKMAQNLKKQNRHKIFRMEMVCPAKDGRMIDIRLSAVPFKDHNGTTAGMIGFMDDITECKVALAELQESEERFRILVRTAAQAVWESDENGIIIKDSASWRGYTGQTVKELLGHGRMNAIHPDDRLIVERSWFKAVASGNDHHAEYRIQNREGGWQWTNEIAAPVKDSKGKIIKWVGMNLDITNRKQTEHMLLESEERLGLALRGADLGLWDWNIKNGTVIYNRQWAEMLGYMLAEVDPDIDTWHQLIHPDDKPNVMAKLQAHFKNETPVYEAEYRMRTKKGGWKWILDRGKVLEKDDSGKPLRASGVHQDITERKLAEEALRKSEEVKNRLAIVVEQATESIVVTDIEGNIEYVNPAFEKHSGYKAEEVLGKNSRFLKSGKHEKKVYAKLWQTVLAGESWKGMLDNLAKNGKQFSEEAIIFPIKNEQNRIINLCKIARNVDREIELEGQLQQAQKMETIGTLAGGIAHDFNNILTPILGYTDMIIQNMEKSNPYYEDLEHILLGAYRAKELIEQILLFSRQTDKERKVLALQPLIKETLKLLRPTIPVTVEIKTQIDPKCKNVLANATQIHQVIMNLCTNAWQAMEQSGGTISIILDQVTLINGDTKNFHKLSAGEYARLTVSDTGPGIKADILDRIFDPFFTTKEVSKGTGLGLSVVHGIVTNHNGEVIARSELNKGTKFQVYLPVVTDIEFDETTHAEKIEGGTENIIIVDDDISVGGMVKAVLDSYGFSTQVFDSAPEALNVIKENPGEYELIISDLTMPKMTGLNLAEKLMKQFPFIPVILMTGYGDNLDESDLRKYGVKKLISKPIIIKDLVKTVRGILDGKT